MDVIKIHSNLYDYEVEFVENFSVTLKLFGSKTAFVIDRKVYNLYKENFSDIDAKNIFFMDADEHKKNMNTVMEIIAFMQDVGIKKDWSILCAGGYYTGRNYPCK